MKLIYCPECQDLFGLRYELRECSCKKSAGQYSGDGLHAIISGPAIPLGIDNASFRQALRLRPQAGQGEVFEAFVIPKICDTILTIKR